MKPHPFIIESPERANEWVDACVRSLNCPPAEAAAILAGICGFPSWDVMIHMIRSMPPSRYDEELNPKKLKIRHQIYIDVLTIDFAFDPHFGRYLIQHLSPSSKKQFRPFSIDTTNMHGPRDPDVLNLQDLLHMSEQDEESLAGTLKLLLGEECPDGVSLSDIEDIVRSMKPVHPWVWFNIFTSLGWDIPEDTYKDEPERYQPAFLINDPKYGMVPVYLSPICRTPYDHNDTAANTAMRESLSHFTSVSQRSQGGFGKSALLLWGFPLAKQINGEDYCHLGMVLRDGEWKEILWNEHVTSFSKLFEINATVGKIDDGHPELVDKDRRFFSAINRHMAGMDDPDASRSGWKYFTTGTLSGWEQVQYYNERMN